MAMAQQDQMPATYVDDEIDLMELIANLWDGKWLIAGVTFCAVLIGIGYLMLAPNNYDLTYRVNPISSSMATQYDQLNAYARQSDQVLLIDASRLHKAALDELNSREPLVNAAKQVIEAYDGLNPRAQGFQEKVESLAYGVEISPLEESDGGWLMQWNSHDEQKAREFLNLTLKQTNDRVQEFITNLFNNRLTIIENQHKNRIEDLNTEIDEAISVYEMKRDRRIAFLREQAAIARELGIAKNTIEAQTFATATSVLTNLNTDSPFYLRGYEAIEEELDLIQSRSDPKPFVDGLVELIQKRRSILNDRTVERAKAAFAGTPLGTDRFQAVQSDPNLLTIENNKRPSRTIALAGIIGGMVGIFTVLIRKGLRTYRLRQANALG
jgi:chain length determinant protein (polysaccharide antigen chain regulator)